MSSYHWNSTAAGKWSVYSYEDRFRGCHKLPSEVSYFEFSLDKEENFDNIVTAAERCEKVYAKPLDWIRCIRCSTHKDLDLRKDYNNALMCNRCYSVVLNDAGDAGTSYEILSCGLKGKVIKHEEV